MARVKIKKIDETLYSIRELLMGGMNGVNSYIVIGSERALVIDTLQDYDHLYEDIRSITDLPFDILITHAHPDHIGIDTRRMMEDGIAVYIGTKEISCFPEYNALRDRKQYKFNSVSYHNMEYFMEHTELFHLVNEGNQFHLGDIDLTVKELPGHTLGSIGLLDEKNKILFSGDGVGSNAIYQQMEYSTSLVTFRDTLDHLIESLEGMPDIKIYTQHQSLKKVHDLKYLRQLRDITDGIISGRFKGRLLKHSVYTGSCMLMKWPILIYQYDPKKVW